MDSHAAFARALAAAFLSGELDVDAMFDRGSRLLGRRWRWLRPLARRVTETFGGQTRPRQITLTQFLVADHGFSRACEKYHLELVERITAPPEMCPPEFAKSWQVPSIRTPAELAEWLNVTIGELEWFADLRTLEFKRNHDRLRHYRYRLLTKRFGRIRLIESPKPRLKHIQRRILAGILEAIPPHGAAHGFRRGRSIKTFAAPHVGKRIVLRIDLEDFFPSLSVAQIGALFRTVGYPETVADLLAGLCTNAAPADVWDRDEFRSLGRPLRLAYWRYAQPHLPQGAPTSPALANLCAYRLDCRLSGLAHSAGADYTRYADDLAFSGNRDFERAIGRFHIHAAALVLEERFSVHHRKTRIMRQGVRQRLAGMVVNQRLNVPRGDFDRLKATLVNCVRLGCASQNRNGHGDYRSHLEGRIAFVEMVNPEKGRRLRRLFNRIQW